MIERMDSLSLFLLQREKNSLPQMELFALEKIYFKFKCKFLYQNMI